MMDILTAGEMRELDRLTIEELGLPGVVLMENAGRAVYRFLMDQYSDLALEGATIICGPGSNGGDGFVVGRLLMNLGFPVRLFFIGDPSKVKGDAAVMMKLFIEMGGDMSLLSTDDDIEILTESLLNNPVTIDAIFGTGLAKPVKGFYAKIIETVNFFSHVTIAVDLPSGIDSDRGKILGTAVMADHTVTMGGLKAGLLLYPGAANAGQIHIAEIGIPVKFFDRVENSFYLLDADSILALLPYRSPDAHKGECGKLLILAGSPGYTGAAALSSLSALRAGAGLVYLAVPGDLNPILEQMVTEVVTVPLKKAENSQLAPPALEEISGLLEKVDAVVFGPGVGRDEAVGKFLQGLLKTVDRPLVIDADGLFHLKGKKAKKAPLIITPHLGEAAHLLGITIDEVKKDLKDAALKLAEKYNATVVLKGAHSLVATVDGEVFLNPTGNPGMASAGMGDVLTGCIGALVAQGLETEPAAICGVFLHGLAGDIAADEIGKQGIIAGDVAKRIPAAFEELGEETGLYRFPQIIL
ncbi:MAG: NAD(P)H-hydrate dehydratase [Chloroflexi bacterium]|nr:NAD(P)H-hydrate dehydratase [Chloroflexota bacterium]